MPSYSLSGSPTVIDGGASTSILIANTGTVTVLVQPGGVQVAPGGSVTRPGWSQVPTTLQTAGQAGSADVTLTAGSPAARPGPGPASFDASGIGPVSVTIAGGSWFTNEGLTTAASFPLIVSTTATLYPAAPASVTITGVAGGVSKSLGMNVSDGSGEVFRFGDLFASGAGSTSTTELVKAGLPGVGAGTFIQLPSGGTAGQVPVISTPGTPPAMVWGSGGGGSPGQSILQYPDHLARFHRRLADQRWSQVHIAVAGNSIVKGQYSNNAGSADEATWRARGWVPQLRDLFANRYGAVGEGMIQGNDSRLSFGGTPQTITSLGVAQQGKRLDAATDTLTYLLPACTDIKIQWYWQDNAGAAPFTYTIDGGGSVTAASVSGTGLFPIESITGLANTTHTLVITGPVGPSKIADISCPAVYTNTTSGVAVHRLHASGGYYDNVVTTGTGTSAIRLKQLTLVQQKVDLLVFAFGHNECGAAGQGLGYTPTSVAAGLADFMTYQTGTNGGAGLIIAGPKKDPTTVGSTYTEDAYYDAMRGVAEADPHVAFLDLRKAAGWTTWATANDLGLMQDNVHPNRRGHSHMAQLVFEALTGLA